MFIILTTHCILHYTYVLSDLMKQVSIIVEADPEVLGDKRVQLAVEGRFCDSAISVREAALELVGRHIASHPDLGFKVCVNACSNSHFVP